MSFITNDDNIPLIGHHPWERHPIVLCFSVQEGGCIWGEFLDIKLTKEQAIELRDKLNDLITFNQSGEYDPTRT